MKQKYDTNPLKVFNIWNDVASCPKAHIMSWKFINLEYYQSKSSRAWTPASLFTYLKLPEQISGNVQDWWITVEK